MFLRDGGVQMRSARFLLPRRPYTLADMEVRLAMKSASRRLLCLSSDGKPINVNFPLQAFDNRESLLYLMI